jgi:hypothetical protein
MNKVFFLASTVFLLALAACKQDGAKSAQSKLNQLSGHWFATDFCSRAGKYGSVLKAMNSGHVPYAYAITFNPAWGDSVRCYNGMEVWMQPVGTIADTIVEIKNARNTGRSITLTHDAYYNKDLTMLDNTGTSGAQLDRYLKSSTVSTDGYYAFCAALNNQLFGGTFSPVGKPSEKITMRADGALSGIAGYDHYEVCTAGDCFVASDKMDIITFSDSRKPDSGKMFGFRYGGQNDTLSIYNLIDQNPDEKGVHTVGEVAHRLLRTKPAKF